MTDPQLAMLVPQLLVAACLVALLPGSEVAEQKERQKSRAKGKPILSQRCSQLMGSSL